jgi:hypothetical protein
LIGEAEMESGQLQLSNLLPLLIPIVILQLGLVIFAITDLVRRKRTKGPKWVWALVILFVNIFGPIIYFIFGREE